MKFLSLLWKGLGEKGKLATLIGWFLVLPINFNFMIDFFKGVMWENPALTSLAVINGIGMIWFILPSKISIKGPKIEIIVED